VGRRREGGREDAFHFLPPLVVSCRNRERNKEEEKIRVYLSVCVFQRARASNTKRSGPTFMSVVAAMLRVSSHYDL